ncbi:hypothetical protein M2372_003138 [Chryseobacterium sp. BIGb0232]|nr:hypothetical protein [Chryseobacterium sp. BIGb0232]ROS10383.1 hypothetical protein EDF65_4265 [Chryseobacterium nakagawai]
MDWNWSLTEMEISKKLMTNALKNNNKILVLW